MNRYNILIRNKPMVTDIVPIIATIIHLVSSISLNNTIPTINAIIKLLSRMGTAAS